MMLFFLSLKFHLRDFDSRYSDFCLSNLSSTLQFEHTCKVFTYQKSGLSFEITLHKSRSHKDLD